MPHYIASYDLAETTPSPHGVFLKKAPEYGWSLWIKAGDGQVYRLPNTTLIGTFAARSDAVAALKSTRKATENELGHKVTMEKWIVAEYSGASFRSDESK